MLSSAGYVTEVVKLEEGYVVKMLILSLNHFESVSVYGYIMSLKGWGKYAVNHSFITAWKESKYGVFSGPYFPVFSPNKRKNPVFGHFSDTFQYLDTFQCIGERTPVYEEYIFCIQHYLGLRSFRTIES